VRVLVEAMKERIESQRKLIDRGVKMLVKFENARKMPLKFLQKQWDVLCRGPGKDWQTCTVIL
jgi:hypothetical protein